MRSSVLALIALLLILAAAPAASAADRYVALTTWFNPSRGDHFTTSDPLWRGTVGTLRSSRAGVRYELIRIEGRVFNPDLPQPPNTVPLVSFWNGDRGDNFLTSNPEWTGTASRAGYRRGRLEGYIFDAPRSDTVPLIELFSSSRGDNYATSDPRLQLTTGMAVAGAPTVASGGYTVVRVEGFIVPLDAASDMTDRAFSALLTATGFGDWRPRLPGETTLPSDPIVRASASVTVPAIIVGMDFVGLALTAADEARYRMFATATDPISLGAAAAGISGGHLRLTVSYAGKVQDPISFNWIGPLHDRTDGGIDLFERGMARRFSALYGYRLADLDLDRDGPEMDEIHYRTRVLKLADRIVDYAAFDRNRDGVVDDRELIVMRFGADTGIGGQMGRARPVRFDGVMLNWLPVLLVAAQTVRGGMMHETLHTWGGTDIYGPRFGLNFGASLMAGMEGDDQMSQLDPWHRMRFGWALPQFLPIGPASRRAGGFAILRAAGHDAAARPLIFYDPARGLSEYFLVEFRTNSSLCDPAVATCSYLDAATPDTGIAVWHLRARDKNLFNVTMAEDTSTRYTWRPGDSATSANSSLGVEGPGTTIGTPRYLRPSDGEMRLRWFADDADTGLVLAASDVFPTSPMAQVRWRDASTPLAPRLDALLLPTFLTQEWPTVSAGAFFAVEGRFGTRPEPFGASVVQAAPSRRRLFVEVSAQGPTRMILRVPSTTPAGRYFLDVAPVSASTTRPGERSNFLKLEVLPPRPGDTTTTVAVRDRLVEDLRRPVPGLAPHLRLPLRPAAKKPRRPLPIGRYPVD